MARTMQAKERSFEEVIYWWPTVCAKATNDWARGFALSITKASRRRNWRPSPKQLGIMRRMVADLFRQEPDDFDVIE